MKIEPFGVEQWMNKWENRCEINLAETCVASLTISELLQIAGRVEQMPSELAAMKMTYGDIKGSARLRSAIASLYDRQTAEQVMITHGTIGANQLIYHTLINPGDVIVSITPTYQQHTAIPQSIGAEVRCLPLAATNGFLPDYDELARLSTGATLIALTNPNNPTGAVIDHDGLKRIASIASDAGAWVLCDEVYRGTEQHSDIPTPSIADLYERGISTGSTSKAFSLAGLRLGWIVGPDLLMQAVEIHRDYSTISVGMIDDYFATMALENAGAILDRSRTITRTNLAILADWVAATPGISFVRPRGGTTAILSYDFDIPSYQLCEALIEDTGVMFTPGSVMGMEGTVRIGFGNETRSLQHGLPRVAAWLDSDN